MWTSSKFYHSRQNSTISKQRRRQAYSKSQKWLITLEKIVSMWKGLRYIITHNNTCTIQVRNSPSTVRRYTHALFLSHEVFAIDQYWIWKSVFSIKVSLGMSITLEGMPRAQEWTANINGLLFYFVFRCVF